MIYRHQLEFDNAELSAIHIANGRVAIRVRTATAEPPTKTVTPNHLAPLRLSKVNGDHIASVGAHAKAIEPRTWKVLDAINGTGRYDAAGESEGNFRKLRRLANTVLQSLGMTAAIVASGTVLSADSGTA